MVRTMQILGICAILAAGGICALSVSLWQHGDPQIEEILHGPSAVERFKASGNRAEDPSKERSPLIVQAEVFALLLNPPKSPEKEGKPQRAQRVAEAEKMGIPEGRTVLRPIASSVNFKLRATS